MSAAPSGAGPAPTHTETSFRGAAVSSAATSTRATSARLTVVDIVTGRSASTMFTPLRAP